MAIEHRPGYKCAEQPALPVWSGLLIPDGPRRHFHGPARYLQCWGVMSPGEVSGEVPQGLPAPTVEQAAPEETPPVEEVFDSPQKGPQVGAYVTWTDRHHTTGHTGKFLGMGGKETFRVQPFGMDGPSRIPIEMVHGWWALGSRKHSPETLIPNPARKVAEQR